MSDKADARDRANKKLEAYIAEQERLRKAREERERSDAYQKVRAFANNAFANNTFDVIGFLEKLKNNEIDKKIVTALETLNTLSWSNGKDDDDEKRRYNVIQACFDIYYIITNKITNNKGKKAPIPINFDIKSEYQFALFAIMGWVGTYYSQAQIQFRLNIQSLRITSQLWNDLDKQSWAFSAIKNLTLTSLTEGDKTISDLLDILLKADSLEELSIINCALTDNDLEKIGRYLKTNSKLKSLNLCGNVFSEDALNKFFTNIHDNTSITEIEIPSKNISNFKKIAERNKKIKTFNTNMEPFEIFLKGVEKKLKLSDANVNDFLKTLGSFFQNDIINIYHKVDVGCQEIVSKKNELKEKYRSLLDSVLFKLSKSEIFLDIREELYKPEEFFNEFLGYLIAINKEKIFSPNQVIIIYKNFLLQLKTSRGSNNFKRLFKLIDTLSDSLPEQDSSAKSGSLYEFYIENISAIVKEAVESFVSARDFKRAIHFLKALEAKKLKHCGEHINYCYKILIDSLNEGQLTNETALLVLLISDKIPKPLLQKVYEIIIKNLCALQNYSDADIYLAQMSKLALPTYDALYKFKQYSEVRNVIRVGIVSIKDSMEPLRAIFKAQTMLTGLKSNDSDREFEEAVSQLLDLMLRKLKLLSPKNKGEAIYKHKSAVIQATKEVLNLLPQQSEKYSFLDVYKMELKHLLISAEKQGKVPQWSANIDASQDYSKLSEVINTIVTESNGYKVGFVRVAADTPLILQLRSVQGEINALAELQKNSNQIPSELLKKAEQKNKKQEEMERFEQEEVSNATNAAENKSINAVVNYVSNNQKLWDEMIANLCDKFLIDKDIAEKALLGEMKNIPEEFMDFSTNIMDKPVFLCFEATKSGDDDIWETVMDKGYYQSANEKGRFFVKGAEDPVHKRTLTGETRVNQDRQKQIILFMSTTQERFKGLMQANSLIVDEIEYSAISQQDKTVFETPPPPYTPPFLPQFQPSAPPEDEEEVMAEKVNEEGPAEKDTQPMTSLTSGASQYDGSNNNNNRIEYNKLKASAKVLANHEIYRGYRLDVKGNPDNLTDQEKEDLLDQTLNAPTQQPTDEQNSQKEYAS